MVARHSDMDVRLFKRLARDWEDHGAVDPFFGVLSDPAKRGGKWDEAAFFESGRRHVDSLMVSLSDAGLTVPRGACLDFGCGVGRLTQPFCDYFDTVVGVDVARAMVRRARGYNTHGRRCRFAVNATPDLRQFRDASFAFVHSCIVLQHLPRPMALGYIGEFIRVAAPGGLVVFQVPAALRPVEESAAALALPEEGYRASIELAALLPRFVAGAHATISARVTNAGTARWRANLPTREAGHIRLANHWIDPAGSMSVRDDGRARLERDLGPGERVEISMVVRAPASPGAWTLELDLVQELVTWFADKGSSTLRIPAIVEPAGSGPVAEPATDVGRARRAPDSPGEGDRRAAAPRATGRLSRFVARLVPARRQAKPTFPMHVIPREDVEAAVASHGARVLRVFEDEAAGPGWISYTYVCTRT